VNEEEGFEKDPLLAREPVNLLKDSGDVVTRVATEFWMYWRLFRL